MHSLPDSTYKVFKDSPNFLVFLLSTDVTSIVRKEGYVERQGLAEIAEKDVLLKSIVLTDSS